MDEAPSALGFKGVFSLYENLKDFVLKTKIKKKKAHTHATKTHTLLELTPHAKYQLSVILFDPI